MKIDAKTIYAVLTGDIVDSSKLHPEEGRSIADILRETYSETQATFSSEKQKTLPFQIDIFRGDSWQLFLSDPKESLRVAVFFRAFLKGRFPDLRLDTRIAVALGHVSSIVKDRVSQSNGPAFQKSGHALEGLRRRRRLAVVPNQSSCASLLDPVVWLIDSIVTNWTPKECLAVSGVLQGATQEEIGGFWSKYFSEKAISQQAVAKFVSRASWDAVDSGLSLVASLIDDDCMGQKTTK